MTPARHWQGFFQPCQPHPCPGPFWVTAGLPLLVFPRALVGLFGPALAASQPVLSPDPSRQRSSLSAPARPAALGGNDVTALAQAAFHPVYDPCSGERFAYRSARECHGRRPAPSLARGTRLVVWGCNHEAYGSAEGSRLRYSPSYTFAAGQRTMFALKSK